jgi:hypothetical protein
MIFIRGKGTNFVYVPQKGEKPGKDVFQRRLNYLNENIITHEGILVIKTPH